MVILGDQNKLHQLLHYKRVILENVTDKSLVYCIVDFPTLLVSTSVVFLYEFFTLAHHRAEFL